MPTVAPFDLDGHILAVEFLGDTPFFANAAGTIHRLDGGDAMAGEVKRGYCGHEGQTFARSDPSTRLQGEDGGSQMRG